MSDSRSLTGKTEYYSLVKEALEHYDAEKHLIFRDKTNPVDNYASEDAHVYNYEVIGIHFGDTNMWVWGWAHPLILPKLTQISRKLLQYGLNSDLPSTLKASFITSRYIIEDKTQLEIHLALASYLTKQSLYPWKQTRGTNDSCVDIWYIILS